MSLANVKKLSKMEMKKIMAGSSCSGSCVGGGCVFFGGACVCSSSGQNC